MSSQALDALAQSGEAAVVAKGAIAAGSASSVIFGLQAEVLGVIAGIVIGLAGLIYNVWATERRLRILRASKADAGE